MLNNLSLKHLKRNYRKWKFNLCKNGNSFINDENLEIEAEKFEFIKDLKLIKCF